MIANSSNQSRPYFYSADDWLAHYEACQASGHRGWHPVSHDELMLADSLGLLALHPEWLPGPQGLKLLGLPDWFGRRQTIFSPEWTERFLQTFVEDPELRSAFRILMKNEVAV